MENTIETKKALTKKELKSVFYRHFQMLGCFSYERQQAIPFCRAMIPALKKLYPEPEEFQKALERHSVFFNTTVALTPFCLGISCAMEEEYANAPEGTMDEASINNVKAAIMGPLAGIGDSFFWGTFRIIAAGIGAPLAVAGNALGIVLYLVLNLVPSLTTRFYGMRIGYQGGREFLAKISTDGTLNKITEAARIVGLTVIGGLVFTIVRFPINLVLDLQGVIVDFQDILNRIMPGLLPLLLSFWAYWRLKKGIHPTMILLYLFALGVVLSLVGIM